MLDASTRRRLQAAARRHAAAQQTAKAASSELAALLREARVSATVRELAEVVGLSHQRIHKLTS
jgi:hypothetical protein